jgi:hypothetical protein
MYIGIMKNASKYIFYIFILYWIISIPLAINQEKYNKKPVLKYLYGIVIPKNYKMFTGFTTRVGKLEYYFYNDKDTICIDAINSSRKQIKQSFPFISMNFKLFSKFVINTRILDRDYVYYYIINNKKYKYSNLELISLSSLKANNKRNLELVSLYKELRKVIIKNEKIDTLRYPNYYFTIKTCHVGTEDTQENKLSKLMGTQLILSSK